MFCDYVALNDVPAHWNHEISRLVPFWRMYWNNTTGAALRVGGKILPLRPDNLYVIPPTLEFATIHHGNCRQLFIHFHIRHPCTFLSRPTVFAIPLTAQRRSLVRWIISNIKGDKTTQNRAALMIHALLDTSIADLTGKFLAFKDIDKRLLAVTSYLEQNLTHPIDNRQLADMMHLHLQTMFRLFKTELGQTPQSYLRQLRVDKACWLLRFSGESIKAIAETTGFYDRYHFTKIFTRFIGLSPARFRSAHRIN